MSNFRVLLHKAKLGDKSAVDDGISIYTTFFNSIGLLACGQFKLAWQVIKRRYSHVEIWLPTSRNEFSYDSCEGIGYVGQCFTSTMRGDNNGTVIRSASQVLKHPERWDYMEIPVPDKNLLKGHAWARTQVKKNKGYNKKTIRDFFNPFRKTKKPAIDGDNICSVACQGFCWMAGLFSDWMIWSPIKLWWKLHKLGYKTKSLKQEDAQC